MSLASVWLWGGTSGTARKRALTEASLCVIVVLKDGVVGVGVQDRKHRKTGKTGSEDELRSETQRCFYLGKPVQFHHTVLGEET